MRKILLLSFILLLSAAVFSGCGNKSAQEAGQSKELERGFRRPDFGQPERQPDARGLVESIVGNEVTILKLERPQRDGEGSSGEKESQSEKEGGQESARLSLGGAGSAGGTGGMMGGPGNFRGQSGRGEMNDESKAAMLEKMKEMSTGKETITIPVGIKMLKRGDASAKEQPSMVEASLSDIAKDKMISLWLNQDITDRKVADFVMIME